MIIIETIITLAFTKPKLWWFEQTHNVRANYAITDCKYFFYKLKTKTSFTNNPTNLDLYSLFIEPLRPFVQSWIHWKWLKIFFEISTKFRLLSFKTFCSQPLDLRLVSQIQEYWNYDSH